VFSICSCSDDWSMRSWNRDLVRHWRQLCGEECRKVLVDGPPAGKTIGIYLSQYVWMNQNSLTCLFAYFSTLSTAISAPLRVNWISTGTYYLFASLAWTAMVTCRLAIVFLYCPFTDLYYLDFASWRQSRFLRQITMLVLHAMFASTTKSFKRINQNS
jgi:hypothetical protein